MRILVDFCCLFVCFLERENGAIEKAHKLREGEAEGGRRDWGREEKHGEGKMWKACRAKLLPVWCLASPSSQTHTEHKASASLSPPCSDPWLHFRGSNAVLRITVGVIQ